MFRNHSRFRRTPIAASIGSATTHSEHSTEQLEQRQLLSADIALETVLEGTGTTFAKAEYKLSNG